MKRIAIFLGGYLPAKKYGGPVTSVANLVENLGDEFSFYIISNDHDLDETKRLDGIQEGWNSVGKAQVLYIPEKEYGYKRFSSILKEINADAVYLSSIFYYSMNLPAIRAAKRLQIPVILAPRGELCDSALQIGKMKKQLYLAAVRATKVLDGVCFHATSQEEESAVMRQIGTPTSRIFLIPNMHGIAYHGEKPAKQSGEVRVVFLARIHEKKNLIEAIAAVNHTLCNTRLDIYGPIEQPEYWERCKKAISQAPKNVTIEYKGALSPEEAKTVFCHYHCFVFPTRSENYGHVIVESLLCRCPVIISKGTTPWDDVDGAAGYTAQLGDAEQLAKRIDTIGKMNQDEYEEMLHSLESYVAQKLKTEEIKQRYRDMFYVASNLTNERTNRNG